MRDFWVFGYGSLIWNPGFDVLERRKAVLYGLHRSLCVRSWVHRGTRETPGLVLGLDRGGACQGIAMRVSGELRESVIGYLRQRELVTNVYIECWRKVVIAGSSEKVSALVYRVDSNHEQYAKGLTLDEQVEIVSRATGRSGINRDYVTSTVEAMRREKIRDTNLEYINAKLVLSQALEP